MKFYGRNRKSRAPLRKSTRSRKSKTTYRKAVKKAKRANFAYRVKQVLNRSLETKVVNYSVQSKPIYNINASNFQGSIVPLAPGAAAPYPFQVSQGVGQGQRVGDKISTQKLMLRGNVRLNTYATSTGNYNIVPGYVCMWVVKLKPFLNDDVSTLMAVINSSFFQSGNGSVAMSGQVQDLYRMPNAQQITVLKRRVWKVGTSSVPQGGGSTGDGTNQFYNNNDFSLVRMFKQDLTSALPSVVHFNDTNDNNVDRHAYLFYTFIRFDGAIPQSSTGVYSGIIPAYVDYELDYTFKDA